MRIKKSIEQIINRNVTKHKYKIAGKRFNRLFNGINAGEYTLITGLPATGKRSLVDYYYLLRILKQWDAIPEDEKDENPLKITYFSTKYSLDYKYIKWVAALHTMESSTMVDVPTILQSAGRLFNISDAVLEKILSKSALIEKAVSAGVLEIIDGTVTPITLSKKLHSVLESQGTVSYDDAGETVFEFSHDNEKMLNIVIVDDLNHIAAGKSTYGEGNMEEAEIKTSINEILSKYAKLKMAIVAVKRTDTSKVYGKYSPSTKELSNLTPTKCIVMYDPLRDKVSEYLDFKLNDYVDQFGINRLKFAYVAYNETGISNINMPLLFMPENGIFAELKLINSEADEAYNEKLYYAHVDKRVRK